MLKVKKFKIVLQQNDNAVDVYLPGSTVSGNVLLELSKPLEIRTVCLEFKGKAENCWSEGSSDNSRTYHSKETLIEYKIIVAGKFENEKTVLPAGLNVFPFIYILPYGIPSTFTGEKGKIRYKVQGTIDIPWAINENTKTKFTVAGVLDLNAPECNEFKEPTTVEVSKNASGLFSSGAVSMRLSINKRCFIPGEVMVMNAEITNNSNRKVNKVWVSLKQYIVFTAQSTKREHIKRLCTITRKGVIAPGATDSWNNVSISVDAILPTNLGGQCSIINLFYAVKFYTNTGLKLSFPVIIGTVPLRDTFSAFSAQPMLPNSFGSAPPSYADQAH